MCHFTSISRSAHWFLCSFDLWVCVCVFSAVWPVARKCRLSLWSRVVDCISACFFYPKKAATFLYGPFISWSTKNPAHMRHSTPVLITSQIQGDVTLRNHQSLTTTTTPAECVQRCAARRMAEKKVASKRGGFICHRIWYYHYLFGAQREYTMDSKKKMHVSVVSEKNHIFPCALRATPRTHTIIQIAIGGYRWYVRVPPLSAACAFGWMPM